MILPAAGLACGMVLEEGGGSVATITFGVLKFARFRMLNISARNWRFNPSVMRVSLRMEKSHVAKPGPGTESRRRSP